MINVVMLVGRIITTPKKVKYYDGKERIMLTIEVTRKFKDIDGKYRTDLITCILWENIKKKFNVYCTKGDLIGIRGRIQVEKSKKFNCKVNNIIAESITLLNNPSTNTKI